MSKEREMHFKDEEDNIYSAYFGPTAVGTDPKVTWDYLWSIPVKDVDEKFQTTIKCRPAHNGEVKDRLQFFETENGLLHFVNEWPLYRLDNENFDVNMLRDIKRKYIVVENAGYEGERDVYECCDYWEAVDWADKTYEPDELEDLHVAICHEDKDGNRSYEN